MSRWDWNYYPPRTAPRAVKDGLKAGTGRAGFSTTWWGKCWIEALERFGWENRLARGRSYARRGQVLDFEVVDGRVQAKVQGSRRTPYQVTIGLKPLSEAQWHRALADLAKESIFAAQLLAGEMPAEIDTLFAAAGASLFPGRARDLATDCSCPDWANPCKHVAAVHYLLAEEIDRDPFLLFTLRGRDREAVLAAVRVARGVSACETEMASATAGDELPIERFWEAGEAMAEWRVALEPAAVPDALLRRLGKPEFAEDPAALSRKLEQIYAEVARAALETGLGEG